MRGAQALDPTASRMRSAGGMTQQVRKLPEATREAGAERGWGGAALRPLLLPPNAIRLDMGDIPLTLDRERAEALAAAVAAGASGSVRQAVEQAIDAWLTEQALAQADVETLQRLWREGEASGAPRELDWQSFKSALSRQAS